MHATVETLRKWTPLSSRELQFAASASASRSRLAGGLRACGIRLFGCLQEQLAALSTLQRQECLKNSSEAAADKEAPTLNDIVQKGKRIMEKVVRTSFIWAEREQHIDCDNHWPDPSLGRRAGARGADDASRPCPYP